MKAYSISLIENKRVLGRVANNSDNGDRDKCSLFWGASAVEVNVKSREVWVKVSGNWTTNEPWVAVEINGYQTNRFAAPKEAQWFCVARNLNAEKENLISIIKDTQAMAGDAEHALFIHEIGLSDEGTFELIPERKLNIEFIGDSITSGEGLAGNPDEMDWISQWMCASKTYARQVAKNLNANMSAVSQCGWGLCWGWDANRNSNIPSHYDNICSLLDSGYQKKLGTCDKYDFSVKNDFVVLNLGTNDNSGLPEIKKSIPDAEEVFVKGVVEFLKLLRHKNPSAKIIWTWGMISLNVVPVLLSKGIGIYKKETGDSEVYTLELESMEKVEVTSADKGSRGHPGPKTHKLAAEKITAFLQSL